MRVNFGELRILMAIDAGANYGYKMREYIQHILEKLAADRSDMPVPQSPSVGAIYTTLQRLEDKQWITGKWAVDGDRGARRRVYSLTDEGKKVFTRSRAMAHILGTGATSIAAPVAPPTKSTKRKATHNAKSSTKRQRRVAGGATD